MDIKNKNSSRLDTGAAMGGEEKWIQQLLLQCVQF